MNCIKCIQDKATGECYEIKDQVARDGIEELKNAGGGGTKLYKHSIDIGKVTIGNSTSLTTLDIIANTNNEFTVGTYITIPGMARRSNVRVISANIYTASGYRSAMLYGGESLISKVGLFDGASLTVINLSELGLTSDVQYIITEL